MCSKICLASETISENHKAEEDNSQKKKVHQALVRQSTSTKFIKDIIQEFVYKIDQFFSFLFCISLSIYHLQTGYCIPSSFWIGY